MYFIFLWQPTLGVVASDAALLYVIMSPVGSYFNIAKQQGISLLADPRYTRAWPGGCGSSKFGSNYAPTIQAQQEAGEKGLHQVLWLYGEDHELTEMGAMNVFVVYLNNNGGKKLSLQSLSCIIKYILTVDELSQHIQLLFLAYFFNFLQRENCSHRP